MVKTHIEHLNLRNHPYGNERRINMSKAILDKGTPFPKGVDYKDIDMEFKKFVEEKLSISYDGEVLPTMSLFSNQNIGEYAQSWKYLDDTGNILLNFKTITRENNPQKGNIYGGMFNIPGNRDYPMFRVPVLQENGQIAYDIYSMKQPMSVDFNYTVNIVTNKYALLNEFNQLVHYQFKALQCYIAPNNHPMSMVLSNVSDESEYSLDDRKFYSQSFQITLRGYIIDKNDFKVTHIPSRIAIITDGDKYSRKNNRNKNRITEEEINDPCKVEEIDERYYYKTMQVNCYLYGCDKEIEFTSDFNMTLSTFMTENVYDFRFFINNEVIDFNETENVEIQNGDDIKIVIEKDTINKDSKFTIIGYDKNVILDKYNNPESSLDEDITSEEIDVE